MAKDDGPPTSRIRVLVVDDHPLTLSGIADLIRGQSDMELSGKALTREETLDLAVRTRPDVIVLDLRLGGSVQNGIELASTLAAVLPWSRVIVYSGHLTETGVRVLRAAGVAGHLSKTTRPEQLALAIRTVAAGDRYVANDGVDERVGRLPRAAQLTAREMAALHLLAEGLENDEMAERLALSPSSVRLCLTSVFAKLGARNRTEAVVKAHRAGMITID